MAHSKKLLIVMLGITVIYYAVLYTGFKKAPSSSNLPNVLLISIDTLRADHLGSYGYNRNTSPYIDSLAKKGSKFDFAISQSPWTLPSFSSILTSLYPSVHGAVMPVNGKPKIMGKNGFPYLDESFETLPEILKKAGFRTACISANTMFKRGLNQGFDHFVSKRKLSAGDIITKSKFWIKKQDRAPFFLFLNFMDTHEPTKPPEPFYNMYSTVDDKPHSEFHYGWWGTGNPDMDKRTVKSFKSHKIALYDGAIAYLDSRIGDLLNWLKKKEMLENTLIIITSDHGEEFYDHREIETVLYKDPRNIVGIGHGHTLFQELIHIPLIISGPGIPENMTHSNTVRAIDIMPTILNYLKIRIPHDLHGISVLPFIKGKMEWPELPAFSEATAYGYEKKSLIISRKKIISSEKEAGLFYDLEKDMKEAENLAEKSSEEQEKLTKELRNFLKDIKKNQYKGKSVSKLNKTDSENLKALGYLQ